MSITLTQTILVIEDTRSEMELMRHYLHDSGYNVVCATTAQEGIAKAVSIKPFAIVTDVVMPGMSGFELCRHLKKNQETASIPVVICSSKDQEIDRLWGMKQGADAYITKPFSKEQLIRAVKSVTL
ncbi:response regulator [Sphaerothrix gracilis]|uniref:response regulator n=1 Tax=Sphaerothrix gracilis TaxID=3151835 RepID=UPI0031FC4C27